MAKETNITTVTMTDGRVVDFPGKRRLQKESFINPDGTVMSRFDFINGETRTFTPPASLIPRFVAHGIEQKLGDETAGIENPDDAVVALDALAARLSRGEWSVVRESGAGFSGAGLVIRALMEAFGKTRQQVVEYIDAKLADGTTRPALYAAFRRLDRVRPIIERLEAERDARRGVAPIATDVAEELDAL